MFERWDKKLKDVGSNPNCSGIFNIFLKRIYFISKLKTIVPVHFLFDFDNFDTIYSLDKLSISSFSNKKNPLLFKSKSKFTCI